METLGDEPWDVVICGTGLQQSLLALALSRSKKRILHLDPKDYYGQHEAAFSLQEVDSWVAAHGPDGIDANAALHDGICRNAELWKDPEAEANGLSFSRAYSLALAPQIVHTRSKLLSQLISSRAYRQVEFLAVASFFVYKPTEEVAAAKLSRIPSSREDVFLDSSIPARSKRSLMKFLKFVIDYDSDEQKQIWEDQADSPLNDFLTSQFKLDGDLRKYILALTLSLDDKVNVKEGLSAINRHLTSMGVFGPGFCAVYPKWGGLSEVAQVACRSGAVGGGIYMLGTSMQMNPTSENEKVSLSLSNGVDIQANAIFSSQDAATNNQMISRAIAIINSPLESLFEVVVEGATVPAVAVVAFPSGTIVTEGSGRSEGPVYAMVHSSDTGECPSGQSVIYLTTLAHPGSKPRLEKALEVLLKATTPDNETTPLCLYQLFYNQTTSVRTSSSETRGASTVFSFPSSSLGLAFDDSDLDEVKAAWKLVMGNDTQEEYMVFEDREGTDVDDNDSYD